MAKDLMTHQLQDTIALLERTPATLDALLRDMPETWTHSNEGEKTWSPFEVVGHLIHGERADWVPRVKMILEFGDTKAFVPFDRGATNAKFRVSLSGNCWTNLRACAPKISPSCAS